MVGTLYATCTVTDNPCFIFSYFLLMTEQESIKMGYCKTVIQKGQLLPKNHIAIFFVCHKNSAIFRKTGQFYNSAQEQCYQQ